MSFAVEKIKYNYWHFKMQGLKLSGSYVRIDPQKWRYGLCQLKTAAKTADKKALKFTRIIVMCIIKKMNT